MTSVPAQTAADDPMDSESSVSVSSSEESLLSDSLSSDGVVAPSLDEPAALTKKAPPRPHVSLKAQKRPPAAPPAEKMVTSDDGFLLQGLHRDRKLLIPKTHINCLIDEIMGEQREGKEPRKVNAEARLTMHKSVEQYLTDFFYDVNLEAMHAKRVTIMPCDILITQRMYAKKHETLNSALLGASASQ